MVSYARLRGLVCSGSLATRRSTAYICCNGVVSINRLLLAVFVDTGTLNLLWFIFCLH